MVNMAESLRVHSLIARAAPHSRASLIARAAPILANLQQPTPVRYLVKIHKKP